MLYIERREKILEMLKKSGNVKVSDLVDIFHVDATTIRRDLKALANDEKIKTVYGGAYYINEMSQWPAEDNPDLKRTVNLEKKRIEAQTLGYSQQITGSSRFDRFPFFCLQIFINQEPFFI